MRRLAVIGGGAWGTALAMVARRAGLIPVLWARDPNVVTAINEQHENPLFLPGVTLDPLIVATTDVGAVASDADAALLTVPAQFLRAVILTFRPILRSGSPVLICAKGIEVGSFKTMS
ncbi:MAG: NAD(P)-binding domain-containing protein, partial [Alphaproteobacteria bacterium]|nr:NAD(P)-binding domain-containing protein [Alphaproteobacteria bacterium]